MITVTGPFLLPLPNYVLYFDDFWTLNWLINMVPFISYLELKITEDRKEFNHLLFGNTSAVDRTIRDYIYRTQKTSANHLFTIPLPLFRV